MFDGRSATLSHKVLLEQRERRLARHLDGICRFGGEADEMLRRLDLLRLLRRVEHLERVQLSRLNVVQAHRLELVAHAAYVQQGALERIGEKEKLLLQRSTTQPRLLVPHMPLPRAKSLPLAVVPEYAERGHLVEQGGTRAQTGRAA